MSEHDHIYLDDVYVQAKSFFDEEDKEAHVVELLEPYLRVCKDKGYAWFMYGESLRVLGRAKEALMAFQKSLELMPPEQKGLVYPRMGMLYGDHISPIEAEKWFNQATQNKAETLGWVWILKGCNLALLGSKPTLAFRPYFVWPG